MCGLEWRVDLLHRRCGSGGRADFDELTRLAGGTRGGGKRSGVKVDLWSVLRRWRIAEGIAVLVYVCLGRRVFGVGFVLGLLGFCCKWQRIRGELVGLQGCGRGLECEGATRDGRGVAGACQSASEAAVEADRGG